MKLHLGCGRKVWPGYINIDAHNDDADLQADIRKLPYADGEADEIVAIHVFEHFWPGEVFDVLKEWRRVLSDGGKLIMELPCMDKILLILYRNPDSVDAMRGLFGEPTSQNNVEDLHKWCWRMIDIRQILLDAGFKRVDVLEPQFHFKKRDMRVEAIK